MTSVISVIMPVFNSGEFLDRAIQSIIDQTFEDWELILVDDGSTDCSAEICDRYARKDQRIKVIHIKNSGAGEARNIGLSKANGDYVFFCDSDDWMEKDYLQALVSGMDNDTDMIYSNFTVETSDGMKEYISEFTMKEYDLSNHDNHCAFLVSYFKNCIGHTLWSRLFRKRIIDENSICFIRTNLAEDMAFIVLYLSFCHSKIRGIENAGYHYTLRNDSLTKKIDNTDHLLDYISYARIIHTHVNRDGYIHSFYPLIFYYFVQPELQRAIKNHGLKHAREIIINNEGYPASEKSLLMSLCKNNKLFGSFLDKKEYQEIRNISEYLLRGNQFRLRIKNRLLYISK